MPTELLIATRNPGKIREMESLLGSFPFRLRSLAECPATTEVEETGATFAENAEIKARAYAAQTGCWTLADDSGLEVDALGGAPGVFSARYGGHEATDADRIELLLKALAHGGRRASRALCQRHSDCGQHVEAFAALHRNVRGPHRPRAARSRWIRLRSRLRSGRLRAKLRGAALRDQTKDQPPRTRTSRRALFPVRAFQNASLTALESDR